MHEWLVALGLGQYEAVLKDDGFDSLDHLTTIVASDLDDVSCRHTARVGWCLVPPRVPS